MMMMSACQDYLDMKSDKSLVTPEQIVDLQALLDNSNAFNAQGAMSFGEAGTDNYYLLRTSWESLTEEARSNYVWGKEAARSEALWQFSYRNVMNANIVLENLERIGFDNRTRESYHLAKGAACFFRGHTFYMVAQIWALPYDPAQAATLPGIPLRITSDLNEEVTRATLQETYHQVVSDLKQAAGLLPVTYLAKTRPSKGAAYGLLSRVYMAMGEYDLAGKYADSCLRLHDHLLDFNTLDANARSPIPNLNQEMLFFASSTGESGLSQTMLRIDTALLSMYKPGDLRKSVYFGTNQDGSANYKGDFSGSVSVVFNGIATGEMLLNRAECLARAGKASEAMTDLNTLLEKRWERNSFVPLSAQSPDDALNIILAERRKELCFRAGLRWTDIRRLNREPRFAITMKRILGSETHTIEPGSPRFAFMLPNSVIQLSGIPQNTY